MKIIITNEWKHINKLERIDIFRIAIGNSQIFKGKSSFVLSIIGFEIAIII